METLHINEDQNFDELEEKMLGRIRALNHNTEQNMVGLYNNINKKFDKMKHEMESMRTLLETKNKDHIETKKKVNEVIEWNRDQLD